MGQEFRDQRSHIGDLETLSSSQMYFVWLIQHFIDFFFNLISCQYLEMERFRVKYSLGSLLEFQMFGPHENYIHPEQLGFARAEKNPPPYLFI